MGQPTETWLRGGMKVHFQAAKKRSVNLRECTVEDPVVYMLLRVNSWEAAEREGHCGFSPRRQYRQYRTVEEDLRVHQK